MLKKLSLTALSAAVLLMSGCAGFPANDLARLPVKDLRIASATKTKVFSRWSLDKASDTNGQMTAAIAAVNKKRFEDALATSECCTLVESPDAADLVVDGTVINENNPAAIIPAIITGLSLYTIPSWVTVTVHITANAKNGATTRSYDLKDSLTMVQWLPMLFAMPFTTNPFSGEKEMTDNAFNTLVAKIKADGLLK
ncbi:MAG: hypothetical protein EOP38_00605 [Rubrivivax sp.]|nr:MAG: hypothetical protein EOP38_00605 [Rubrivivax sp.]